MESKIIITSDGSGTIFIPEWNECYHSRNGAITESAHIFINAGYRIAAGNKAALNILEVGFGTGLNALLTLIETKNDQRDVYYLGVEPFRPDKTMLAALNYPALLTGVQDADKYFNEINNTVNSQSITEHFFLDVREEKIEDVILEKSFFDLVYFDAFAPAIFPELWSSDIFGKIYLSMKDGGILVTYSCKGDVKRALKSAGFSIEKLSGPPGKREFLRALK